MRYIGPVAGRQPAGAQWVGVDLDFPHGEHAGEVEGVRYFTCAANKQGGVPRLHGALVRPQQVRAKPSP